MNFPRSSGILLHPTSLPGPFGVGDLGPQAYAFADFLLDSGQSLWQVLPLGPPGYGDSPYACYSAFAGNTLLISPEQLLTEGLLERSDLPSDTSLASERVDFAQAHALKNDLLRKAYERYTQNSNAILRSEFEAFAQAYSDWLKNYALFRALKDAHGGVAWNEWESALAHRTPAALVRAREQLQDEVAAHMFYQFLFFRQWFALKSYCSARGIQLVGDLPIFVAHDSADVWTNPDKFKLDKHGSPIVVAGVPPDYFSTTGQLWGNPLYNWNGMREEGFEWWIERVRATLEVVDIVRVDHFRGFAACWEIPGGDQTAERGQWVEAPGRELFTAIRKALGELPIIAEDLGVITPDVVGLRDEFGFPGMRILQFGFSSDPNNMDLPHNYSPNVVAYTGTHDNDTTVGWFRSVAGESSTRTAKQIDLERTFCLRYLDTDGKEIHWDFIRAVLASVANTAIVPLQDVLGLGTESRMNLPNSTEGNWMWRYEQGALTDEIKSRLSELTELYGRDRRTTKESCSEASPWSAPTCRRFSPRRPGAATDGNGELGQSADRSAHSKELSKLMHLLQVKEFCLFRLLAFCIVNLAVAVVAQDITKLEKIGPVVSFTKSERAVVFNCQDKSQVQVTLLAPDLVRIRASFARPIPARDHSWAIAKADWQTPRWSLSETTDSVVITTDEIEVVVRRSPLLIEFRDARSHSIINADEQPMAYDAKALLKEMMFDPKAGTFVAASKKLGFDEHFYGLGEKAARLDKRRGSFVNWNSDTFGYTEGKDPIYQTVPFYTGLQNGRAYGIFFDNSYRSYFDFGKSSQQRAWFGAEGGEMNYYFFYGPSLKKILNRYADLTGHMPMPPLWALGNQQSRWSYYPDTMVQEVVSEYRKRDLPLDVVHLDIDYMQGYRVFTWDRGRFPNPKALSERLGSQGVKLVAIVDPGVKHQPVSKSAASVTSITPELEPQEQRYYVFEQGIQKKYFQYRTNGDLFVPRVWPGESVFVDYTLPAAREWWGSLHRAYTDNGVAGIWTDMNEPADFVDQTGKNQIDVVSYDEGEKSTHAKNRNVFALLMARATYEGLERLRPNQRPYVITRAAYAGIQRYSTMWTGDTPSSWESLQLNIPMFTTLGLSGQPFVGSDVGGFIGRGNGELLVRAYQISFLAPFCRNHKVIDGYDQEPWRFGQHYEDIIRKYLKLRYQLLPFLYTSLEDAHRTGAPLFRPLVLNYQDDPNTYNLDDQFMIGNDLLVAPIAKPDITRRLVYLPNGMWYDYWTSKKYEGGKMISVDAPLETVPLFVRAGAIIPMWPEMKYVGEKPADPLTFNIYPDASGSASGTLYEDDGVSPAYKQDSFRRTTINARRMAAGYEVTKSAPVGQYQPGERRLSFVVKSPDRAPRATTIVDDGRMQRIKIN